MGPWQTLDLSAVHGHGEMPAPHEIWSTYKHLDDEPAEHAVGRSPTPARAAEAKRICQHIERAPRLLRQIQLVTERVGAHQWEDIDPFLEDG